MLYTITRRMYFPGGRVEVLADTKPMEIEVATMVINILKLNEQACGFPSDWWLVPTMAAK